MSALLTRPAVRRPCADLTRRRLLGGAGGLAAGILIGGCADEDAPLLGEPTPSATATTGRFPRTVEHIFGTTTIPSEPERVVAMIEQDADTLLALGVLPVGVHSRYGFDNGYGPWAQDELDGRDLQVWSGREFNLEGVAAANPDLIVFATAIDDRDLYDRLSGIAPTVFRPKGAGAFGATDEQKVPLIADALGRPEEGRRLLEDLDAYLDEQVAENVPDGTSINYLDIYPGGIALLPAGHTIHRALARAGFDLVPAPGEEQLDLSVERVADYAADVMLVYPFERSREQIFDEVPTLRGLAESGRSQVILLEDLALSNGSVLSLPYALDRLLPEIDFASASASPTLSPTATG